MFAKILLVPAAISAFAMAAPSHAATLLFDFAGGARSFSFTLDSTRAPDAARSVFGSNQITFNNVSGMFNGVQSSSTTATSISFGTGILAPISLSAPGFGFGNFSGPNLFNGSLTDPMFNLGTFRLGQVNTGAGTGGGNLTISQVNSAVPEPSTWAMLLLGFAGIGFSMRKLRSRKGTGTALGAMANA